jgi:transposase InsO family protein
MALWRRKPEGRVLIHSDQGVQYCSMKNAVKVENYYYPWELEKAIADWVEYYNHER